MHSTSAHRFEALDSWRGIAAMAVALLHIPLAHAYQHRPAVMNVQMAVDFFFVLSGFVISHASLGKLETAGQFLSFAIRRIGRVWPLHVAVLAGFVAMEAAKLAASGFVKFDLEGAPFTESRSVGSIVTNFFLVQSFNLHGTTTWNGPGWSISAEVFAYFVFGLATLALGAAAKVSMQRIAVYAGVALYGFIALALMSKEGLFSTHDFGMFRCLYGFFTGCVAWQVWRGALAGLRLPLWAGTLLEIACVTLVLTYVGQSGRGALSLAAPVFAAALVLVFALEQGALSQALRTAPFLALGRWSYSIYMIHMLLFAVVRIGLTLASKAPGLKGLAGVGAGKDWTSGSSAIDLLFVAVTMSLLVACAAFTFRFIEEPARRWFARQADKAAQGAANLMRPARRRIVQASANPSMERASALAAASSKASPFSALAFRASPRTPERVMSRKDRQT